MEWTVEVMLGALASSAVALALIVAGFILLPGIAAVAGWRARKFAKQLKDAVRGEVRSLGGEDPIHYAPPSCGAFLLKADRGEIRIVPDEQTIAFNDSEGSESGQPKRPSRLNIRNGEMIYAMGTVSDAQDPLHAEPRSAKIAEMRSTGRLPLVLSRHRPADVLHRRARFHFRWAVLLFVSALLLCVGLGRRFLILRTAGHVVVATATGWKPYQTLSRAGTPVQHVDVVAVAPNSCPDQLLVGEVRMDTWLRRDIFKETMVPFVVARNCKTAQVGSAPALKIAEAFLWLVGLGVVALAYVARSRATRIW